VRWGEIAWRSALIAGVFGAVAASVAPWITAVLGFTAIAATAELAIRPYAANAIDKLLMGSGAVVTAFIIVGLGLTLTPWGLTRITADVAWLVLSLAVLFWRRQLRSTITLPAGEIRSLGIWVVLAGLILAGGVVLAAAGVRHWDQRPALAFALVVKNAGSVVVEIEATSVTGRYQIVATSKVHGAQQYSSPLLTVKAGGAGQRLREQVPINIAGVWTIQLQSAQNSAVVRYLIVNVS
jgi:uncharacterized protein YjeT (DUF2065 family)